MKRLLSPPTFRWEARLRRTISLIAIFMLTIGLLNLVGFLPVAQIPIKSDWVVLVIFVSYLVGGFVVWHFLWQFTVRFIQEGTIFPKRKKDKTVYQKVAKSPFSRN